MTPLEQAQRQKKYGCDTCGKRVVVRGVSYCEVSGKLLLPSLFNCGQCAHVPSEYEPKGDDMKTREEDDIEQRDMIELPCKIYSTNSEYPRIQIVWRGKGGIIRTVEVDEEWEADEYWAVLQKMLKEGRL